MSFRLSSKKTIMLLCLLAPLAALALAGLSGHSRKAYSHLTPNDSISVAGEMRLVSQIAQQYMPAVGAGDDRAEPDWIWYEVTERVETLQLVYFPTWGSETHPSWLLDILYAVWRYFYYGSTRDIEYIELSVRKSDGAVVSAEFESPIFGDLGVVKHTKNFIDEGDELLMHLHHSGTNDSLTTVFIVASWNHLFNAQTITGSESTVRDRDIKYLDERTFVRYKMHRRSLPDSMD